MIFIFLLFDRGYEFVFSLSVHHFLVTVSSSWKVLAVFRTFPWFFNSTDRLLEEQELTRKKEEYVAQLKSELAQISVLISLS